MRWIAPAITLLVGVIIGLFIRPALVPDRLPPVQLNHVGVAASNLDESLAFYTAKMGFPVSYQVHDKQGNLTSYHLRVGPFTELELQRANATRPPGISHVGLWVDDIAATVKGLRARGVQVEEPFTGFTRARVANLTDPDGVKLELLELPAESMQRQHMQR